MSKNGSVQYPPEIAHAITRPSSRPTGRRRYELAKRFLIRAGARLSTKSYRYLDSALNYLSVGSWVRQFGFQPQYVATREQVWDQIRVEVADKQVLYLEFGVYKGNSMRYWSRALRNPLAVMHGFDSFEGLPEAWDSYGPAGTFSTNGRIPDIADARATFIKGWFQDTLPLYEPPRNECLVVTFDADLYSSTRYVLGVLKPHIVPGTFLYFDEFCSRSHELRAFDEFLKDTGTKVRMIAANRTLENVAFVVVTSGP